MLAPPKKVETEVKKLEPDISREEDRIGELGLVSAMQTKGEEEENGDVSASLV